MSLFGWQGGRLANLTAQWLPNGADDIEGSGELVPGDFDGDGLTDIFISGNADIDPPLPNWSTVMFREAEDRGWQGSATSPRRSWPS